MGDRLLKPGLFAPVVLTAFLSGTPAYAGDVIAADLKTRDGATSGHADIQEAPGGAFIRFKLSGLTAGAHAVKIHEAGKCEGDFASAGAILNPLGAGQGLLNVEGPAAGDLPNVFASATGDAEAEFVTSLLQPGADEGDALLDEDGSAFIIYDKPDDHLGLVEGVIGQRIACGVISKSR